MLRGRRLGPGGARRSRSRDSCVTGPRLRLQCRTSLPVNLKAGSNFGPWSADSQSASARLSLSQWQPACDFEAAYPADSDSP